MKHPILYLGFLLCVITLIHTKVFAEEPELVMTPGMTITAQTKAGEITISAGPTLERAYSWEGASRSTTLIQRPKRWYGSLGAYYPGPGEHWPEHNGITRGVLEEGQQHFDSEEQALDWLQKRFGNYLTVYRDDGLAVSFSKEVSRRQINVEVWQIFIRGVKPLKLPGSSNDKITVTPPNQALQRTEAGVQPSPAGQP